MSASPSLQNAVDAVPGWTMAFPPSLGIKAGSLPRYDDPRIRWAIENFGSLQDQHVLELWPRDGGHTSMLEAAGATVDAVEANRAAFMRCLIAREIFGLTRAKFWLGDFIKALEEWDRHYGLIIACDVLERLEDPLRLIELAARRSDAIYFWTHLVTGDFIANAGLRRNGFAESAEVRRFRDVDVRIYGRTSTQVEEEAKSADESGAKRRLLHRDDLLQVLGVVGFNDIRLCRDEPHHDSEPALSILARR